MPGLLEVTQDSFDTEVRDSDLPVLVDFWGPRCGPCLGLMPIVEELAARYLGKVKFCKVNCAENRRLAVRLKVMSLPTFLFFKAGDRVAELTGEFGQKEIEDCIKALAE
ncbi:thioredoxin family protein [Desulfomonile tiedjei]|uniref:Thioredoxin n=1 Tax=Desulfomonile tiedjei (strain ATCC 49306 / DSM 6799 / DCB-1) TaxID=706587 RepID=I4CBS4_DESTA|nr:thioredoxin domain-containing protein [Desulfomonile tiedjei]AFM27015.1 thioredoxin domain-containing protein [Desulfomonile tiedjei DSM 6799]